MTDFLPTLHSTDPSGFGGGGDWARGWAVVPAVRIRAGRSMTESHAFQWRMDSSLKPSGNLEGLMPAGASV